MVLNKKVAQLTKNIRKYIVRWSVLRRPMSAGGLPLLLSAGGQRTPLPAEDRAGACGWLH